VRFAATESRLQTDHRIAALARKPLQGRHKDALQPLGQKVIPKKPRGVA
jgi:hypothetical protein